jgi:hypothetical protein
MMLNLPTADDVQAMFAHAVVGTRKNVLRDDHCSGFDPEPKRFISEARLQKKQKKERIIAALRSTDKMLTAHELMYACHLHRAGRFYDLLAELVNAGAITCHKLPHTKRRAYRCA